MRFGGSIDGQRFGGRLGVRFVLAIVVLVPFIALGAVSTKAFTQSRAQSSLAQRIDRQTDRVATLSRAQSSANIEGLWGGITATTRQYDLAPTFVTAFSGFDPLGSYEAAMVRTDEAIVGLDDTIRSAVMDARATAVGENFRDTTIDYLAAGAALDVELAQAMDELEALADRASFTGATGPALRRFALAVAAHEATADAALGSYSVRYQSLLTPGDEVRPLLSGMLAREELMNRLEQSVTSGNEFELAWKALQEDNDTRAIISENWDMVRRIEADGTAELAQPISLANFRSEEQRFRRTVGTFDAHAALVEAAASDLRTATARELAEDENARAVLAAGLLLTAALTVLASGLAGRWLIVPLLSISTAAERLRAGEVDAEIVPTGPHEVHTAGLALSEAVESLRLVERQAAALADERLNDESLSVAAPGRLGRSLQEAVSQLIRSLSAGEAYRARLVHDASHDPLTGLLNRSAALGRLTDLLTRSRGQMMAVLFVDLDGFKLINDTSGHAAGDQALVEVAKRLTQVVRTNDVVGRLGGDEFVVIAPSVGTSEVAEQLAGRIIDAVCAPMRIKDSTLSIGVSVGIAISSSDQATAEELLLDADLALYRSKERGRRRYEICDPGLKNDFETRTEVEAALRGALANDELALHFQPVVSAETGETRCLEALVRWVRPDGEIWGPDVFLRIAEQTALICDLDSWVIDEAAHQLARWSDDPAFGPVPVAVNLSAVYMSSGSAAADIVAALDRHAVGPERLGIEINEATLISNEGTVAEQLGLLRALGVRIAIDDFGTGYASTSVLRALPVDILKIDQTFVQNLEDSVDHSLIRLMTDTAHLLGQLVVAEGVETRTQAMALRQLGVDRLQGYLFARPTPPSSLVLPSAEQEQDRPTAADA